MSTTYSDVDTSKLGGILLLERQISVKLGVIDQGRHERLKEMDHGY